MNTKNITFETWAFFRTALLMAVLTAGLALPPAARAVAESEPNDSMGQANTIGPNDTITAAIGFTGDQDWYQVM